MKINLKWRVLDLHNRKKEEKEKEHAPDYRKYTFSRKEILLYGAPGSRYRRIACMVFLSFLLGCAAAVASDSVHI